MNDRFAASFTTAPNHFSVDQIEHAILSLEHAIATTPGEESAFQKIFEEHPVILAALGYDSWIAHPILPHGLGRSFIPDFITLRRGTFEIVDLKTPTTRIHHNRERRNTFYKTFDSYVSQVDDYSRHFDDSANRRDFHNRFGAEIEPHPLPIIIAGLDHDSNKSTIRALCRRFSSRPTILTYNDIVSEIERLLVRTVGHPETLPGGTIFFRFALLGRHQNRTRFLAEQSANPLVGSWSLYLECDESLTFTIRDVRGSYFRISGKMPADVDLETPTMVTAEFGSSTQRSVIRLRINDSIIAESRSSQEIRMRPESLNLPVGNISIGSSSDGKHVINGDIAGLLVFEDLLPFRDRIAAWDRFVVREEPWE